MNHVKCQGLTPTTKRPLKAVLGLFSGSYFGRKIGGAGRGPYDCFHMAKPVRGPSIIIAEIDRIPPLNGRPWFS